MVLEIEFPLNCGPDSLINRIANIHFESDKAFGPSRSPWALLAQVIVLWIHTDRTSYGSARELFKGKKRRASKAQPERLRFGNNRG